MAFPPFFEIGEDAVEEGFWFGHLVLGVGGGEGETARGMLL